MNALFAKIDNIIKYLCAAALAGMVLLIFINTVLRYFLNSSIVSTEEICRFLFVWATFLAIISVWHKHGHIAVTTITDRLHGKSLILFRFACSFLTLICFVSIVYGSYEYIGENSYYAQITGISYGFMILPVAISGAICLLITIEQMLQVITGKAFMNNDEEAKE